MTNNEFHKVLDKWLCETFNDYYAVFDSNTSAPTILCHSHEVAKGVKTPTENQKFTLYLTTKYGQHFIDEAMNTGDLMIVLGDQPEFHIRTKGLTVMIQPLDSDIIHTKFIIEGN